MDREKNRFYGEEENHQKENINNKQQLEKIETEEVMLILKESINVLQGGNTFIKYG